MKVTLYIDENEGNVLEVKDKILSVLHPDHIIFDNWDGYKLNYIRWWTRNVLCNHTFRLI